MRFLQSIFLGSRFFKALGIIILCFILAFFIPLLFWVSLVLLVLLVALFIHEFHEIYRFNVPLRAYRNTKTRWSLSDENEVQIGVINLINQALRYEMIDELPVQLQERNFLIKGSVSARGESRHVYKIRPMSRGLYHFKNIYVFVLGRHQFIKRRLIFEMESVHSVYPSFIQMKSAELFMTSNLALQHGIKKRRSLGLSYEFDQIKPYAFGDDIRQINWKSSARQQQLMSNLYEDEKSQSVYNIIDKSRVMLSTSNGLSLLDYAINTSLSLSHIALKRQDHVGLMCFSDKMGAVLKADRQQHQLQRIMELLYKQEERDLEADFENLYKGIRKLVKTRSLLFIYTNFESKYALDRVKPILKKLSSMHLMVMVFFENSSYYDFIQQDGSSLKYYVKQILIEQALSERQTVMSELKALGFHTISCKPEELSVHTINKYLEIKSRGLI